MMNHSTLYSIFSYDLLHFSPSLYKDVRTLFLSTINSTILGVVNMYGKWCEHSHVMETKGHYTHKAKGP